jgi:uncharacterized protein with HEPN domain
VLHEYDHVNLDLVWPIVTEDVPRLVAQLIPLAPAPPDGHVS